MTRFGSPPRWCEHGCGNRRFEFGCVCGWREPRGWCRWLGVEIEYIGLLAIKLLFCGLDSAYRGYSDVLGIKLLCVIGVLVVEQLCGNGVLVVEQLCTP